MIRFRCCPLRSLRAALSPEEKLRAELSIRARVGRAAMARKQRQARHEQPGAQSTTVQLPRRCSAPVELFAAVAAHDAIPEAQTLELGARAPESNASFEASLEKARTDALQKVCGATRWPLRACSQPCARLLVCHLGCARALCTTPFVWPRAHPFCVAAYAPFVCGRTRTFSRECVWPRARPWLPPAVAAPRPFPFTPCLSCGERTVCPCPQQPVRTQAQAATAPRLEAAEAQAASAAAAATEAQLGMAAMAEATQATAAAAAAAAVVVERSEEVSSVALFFFFFFLALWRERLAAAEAAEEAARAQLASGREEWAHGGARLAAMGAEMEVLRRQARQPIRPLAHWPISPLAHWPIGPLAHWPIGPLAH
eukprot:3566028-Prymnesium_polylepis.2